MFENCFSAKFVENAEFNSCLGIPYRFVIHIYSIRRTFFIFCYSHHRQYIRTKFSFITFALQIKLTFEGHLRFVRSAGGSYGKATTSKLFSFLVTKSFNKMRNFVAKTSLVCVVVFVSLVIVFC